MEYCKLQIGCLLVVLYLTFIFEKECRRFGLRRRFSRFRAVLGVGIACLVLDGVTAWTVNHRAVVPAGLNLVLHGLFLVSIDALIFTLFLYILDATGVTPRRPGRRPRGHGRREALWRRKSRRPRDAAGPRSAKANAVRCRVEL